MLKKATTITLMLVCVVFFSSVSMTADCGKKHMKNIVETAIAAGSFETLVAAVKAANLADTLSGSGPFTVFAPTDEAFKKLPAGTVEALLEDTEKLASILTYHVAADKLMASDVVKMKTIDTVNGKSLSINVKDGNVMIDNAMVIKTDILTSNGIIHVIDAVVIPN